MAFTKTACPVSREQFASQAPHAVPVTVQDKPVEVSKKAFSTGSMGWYFNEKQTLTLNDGTKVPCQVAITITLVGSKELPPQ